MEYKNLKDQPIEDVLNQVQGFAAMASESQVRSMAALLARCTIEVAASLGQVWGGLFDVKKALVNASVESAQQTAALVRWTKVLAWMTGAYTIITGGLLIVGFLSLRGR